MQLPPKDKITSVETAVTSVMTASPFARAPGERYSDVLATPYLIAELERACAQLLEPLLQRGELSVGARISDNGPELTALAMLAWQQGAGVARHYIQPGKPIQNAFAEQPTGWNSAPTPRAGTSTAIQRGAPGSPDRSPSPLVGAALLYTDHSDPHPRRDPAHCADRVATLSGIAGLRLRSGTSAATPARIEGHATA